MGTTPRQVFIGYDREQPSAYAVCEHSMRTAASCDLDIQALGVDRVRHLYTRKDDPLSSTEFTYRRFFAPLLARNGTQPVLFCDSDFFWNADVNELFDLFDSRYAVQVVKHEYEPLSDTKMGGKPQTRYPRKNWSSLILWNPLHDENALLTKERINTRPGSWLHQFRWLNDESIGALPVEWNWLHSYGYPGHPKAVHFTDGTPMHRGHRWDRWSERWSDCLTVARLLVHPEEASSSAS